MDLTTHNTKTDPADLLGDPNEIESLAGAFGPYTVIRRLGAGMQGVAYLAAAPHGPSVVIKAVEPTRRSRRAMDEEVRALRAVGGIFAPSVLDYRPEALRPYLVMEYLEGRTLEEELAGGLLSETGTLRLAVGLSALLSAVHAAAVAHGDFRAKNLIVSPGGLYAVDYGCARLRADSRSEFRRRRQADLLWLGIHIARAGSGAFPFSDDWGKAIEDYHDGKIDLGSMSGVPRAVARALLSNRAGRRPAAHTIHARLLGSKA
ncbi:MAG TPA: protein kinase [Actinocrinis sp.]|nr:protein kinase [Actinocrinis sp.]